MKFKRAFSFFLTVVMILSVTAAFASAAGDTMQTATAINLNKEYSGSITSTNKVDFYKFTLSESGKVNLRLTAYIKETDYYLYDANANKVWSKTYQTWNATSEEFNLDTNLNLTSGTYYFSVQQRNGTGKYSFKLTFTSANESFAETFGGNNNSIATASAISLDKQYKGQIALNDSKDIYKFTLPSSGRVNVRVTAYIYITDYYLYDANGKEVWKSRDQYWNVTSLEYNKDENLDLTSGTYYFSVQQRNGTGNYDFKLSFTGANESFAETFGGINNSIATASEITLGTQYKGQLALNDPNDIYKFTLPSSGMVNIRLTAYIYITDYYLYDANGKEVWKSRNQYWNETSLEYNKDENLDLTSGTYYFSVQQRNGTGNYDFKLSFTGANESFAETFGGSNNSIADASAIALGTLYNGQLALNDSKDIYKFTISASDSVRIRITAHVHKIDYYLYDADGKEVWKSTNQTWNSTSFEYKKDESVDLSSGTYYFSVQQRDGTGNYSFVIGESGDPCAAGHAWDGGKVTTPATATTDGVKTFTCTRCGATKTEPIPATGDPNCEHTHTGKAHKDATCTEAGYDRIVCDDCGKALSETVIPALGHDLVSDAAIAATCTNSGKAAGVHCTRCAYAVGRETVPALGHSFKNGFCTRCGASDPSYRNECDGGWNCPSYAFYDVRYGDWFHEAVDFAVARGLFNGMTKTSFAPNAAMTRAMLVTVLWRYEGSPIDGYSHFVDVPSGQWYSNAVAWAMKYGIVNGITPIQFSPNGNITREQMAAILYRYATCKGYNVSVRGSFAGFSDRNKVSSWATEAYAWAVGMGMITGNVINGKTLLDPQGNATRAQVATILMRFIKSITSTDPTEPTEPTTAPTEPTEPISGDFRVALITDYGSVTDKSYNQATYEGCRSWCEENGVDYTYYKPTGDSTAERIEAVDQAIADGYNVLLLPGYAHAGAIVETCELYPDVKFIALDVNDWDFQDAAGHSEDMSWKMPSNVFSALYHEELAGYMAGYAAVKLGYRRLGILGGMAVPAVVRYGYGFLQGADQAAKDLSITNKVSVKYVYGNQFFGDADITAYADAWYAGGTEVVFACGGGIYTSAAEAAAKVGGKVIGVDVDQAPTIDAYGKGMTVTSAMKNLGQTVHFILSELKNGKWSAHGGKIETLGLVSEDPAQNFVGLPDSTQWYAGGFTKPGYEALVKRLFKGELKVSASIDVAPALSISVDYQGNIK